MQNRVMLTVAALLLLAAKVEAAHLCDHCGCHRNCKKICRLVCGKKKETKIEYSSECEDFCVPGHSKKCGVKIECDCDGHHRKIIWQPTCARVRTRRKLVKKEVTKEVPDYKWVVEEYCCVCGHLIKVDGDADNGRPDSKSKAERLPVPMAGNVEDQLPENESPVAFRAYYSGADADTSAELTGDELIAEGDAPESSDDVQTKVEMPFDEPKGEPRRLFPALFGR